MSYEKVENIADKLSNGVKKIGMCGIDATKKASKLYDRLPNSFKKVIVGSAIFMAGLTASKISTETQYGQYPDGHYGTSVVVNGTGKPTAWLGIALLASLSAESKRKIYNWGKSFGKGGRD